MSQRILIVGGPRTGKTTLANRLGREHKMLVRHSDSLIGVREWSDDSEEVARWFDQPGPWIVEGVTVVRALRKWLASHPTGKPADMVMLMSRAKVPRTVRQDSMAKGVDTVWREIVGELRARGAMVRFENPPQGG